MLLYYIFLIPFINLSYISYSIGLLFSIFLIKLLLSKPLVAPIIDPNQPKNPVFLSILIPIYNEEQHIKNLIDILYSMSHNHEIIFINDLSTDNSLSILNKYQINYNYKIVNRMYKTGHVAGVLNAGLQHVSKKSNYIGVINGDCHFNKDLISNVVQLLENTDISVLNLSNTTVCTKWCEYIAYLEKIFKNGLFKHAEASLNNGYFIRKSLLMELKGWSETTLTEDLELNLRIKKKGYTIYQSDLEIVDTVPETFKKLFNQKYRWIKGDIINRYKYFPKDLYEIIVNIYYIFPLLTLVSFLISWGIFLRNIFLIQLLIFMVEASLFYKFTNQFYNSLIYPISQFMFSIYFYIYYMFDFNNKW